MKLTSKQKGNLTELQCLTAFYENGCHVSLPYGENSRYDMIVDVDGQLIKVQVKTSSSKTENSISFSCRSSHVNCSGTINVKYTKEEIDYFATFWEGQCYLIPVSECSTQKTLRFEVPKSGQVKGISFASNYRLELQLEKIKNGGSN